MATERALLMVWDGLRPDFVSAHARKLASHFNRLPPRQSGRARQQLLPAFRRWLRRVHLG